MNKPIDRETILAAITSTQKEIDELERYFSVTSIDRWPYVVAIFFGTEPTGALQILAKHADGQVSYNFAATGRNAAQYSKADAERIARDLIASTANGEIKAMGKYQFFETMLERNRRVLLDFKELLQKVD